MTTVLDSHGKVLAEGRRVRVTVLAGTGGFFGDILSLDSQLAQLRLETGEKMEVPVRTLLLCRRDTDRIDQKGYLLDKGASVLISSYGGQVTKVDVGGKGRVVGFTKTKAVVDFVSDYAKTKAIPFEYLTLLPA
jgi:hypothetical protein